MTAAPRAWLPCAALAAALILTSVASLGIGQLGWIHPLAVWDALAQPDSGQAVVIWELRLPRLLLALLVGANLAVAGVMMQAVFHNPLAEPYLVGVSSGAIFAAIVAMVTPLAAWMPGPQISAFLGALATSYAVIALARAGGATPAALLLTGLAFGGLLQALTTVLLLLADVHQVRSALAWMMGSLAYRGWPEVRALAPASCLGVLGALVSWKTLNLMALGDDTAHHLGLRTHRARFLLLAWTALLAGSAVAAVGVVAFVGLMVPHLCRLLVGPHHLRLIPAAALGGALLVLWSDIAARSLAPGQEIPLGAVTSVLGCGFFLVLLRQTSARTPSSL